MSIDVQALELRHPGFQTGTRLSASVGVTATLGQPHGQQPEAFDLLKTVNLALYAGKESGRDRVKSLPAATNTNRIAIAIVPYRVMGDS